MGKHEKTENRIKKEGSGAGKILWWIPAAAMAALTLGKLWYYYTLMDAGSALWPAVAIISALGLMVGAGGSALVSKTLGEGDTERANHTFTMLIRLTLIAGTVISAIIFIFMT